MRGESAELRYCLMKMGFSGRRSRYYGGPTKDPRHKDYPYFHVKAFLAHPFSVMRYLCGRHHPYPGLLRAPGFRQAAGENLLSHTSIHVRFVNGCTGYLLSHRGDTPSGLGGWWSIEVGGTKGDALHRKLHREVDVWTARRVGLGEEPPKRVSRPASKTSTDVSPAAFTRFWKTSRTRCHGTASGARPGCTRHVGVHLCGHRVPRAGRRSGAT